MSTQATPARALLDTGTMLGPEGKSRLIAVALQDIGQAITTLGSYVVQPTSGHASDSAPIEVAASLLEQSARRLRQWELQGLSPAEEALVREALRFAARGHKPEAILKELALQVDKSQ